MASLRARTIAALMGVALVPAAILASVWYRSAETGFTRSAKSALVASASRAAASIDGFVNAGLDATRTLAQLPRFQHFLVSPNATNRRDAQAVLSILGSSDATDITSYQLLTPDGRVLLSSDGDVALGALVTDPTVLAAANAVVPRATELRFRSADPQDGSFFIAAAVRGPNGRTVGKLAGGIAHDFNNLLTVVSQNAELAIDEPGLPAPVREALTDIVDAADRGAGLTRQLLTFAKRGASTPRLVDVRAAVLSNERLLRQVLGSHIRVHLDLPERPLAVFIDATQLEQRFVNLAANARDAMPRGGSLRIWLRDEAPTADFPGGCVALEFADSGTGMTPNVALRVFEPFCTTKPDSRGTGLGLSTVYGIVTQAGGTIGLESAEEEGTTFTLRFPRGAGEASAIAAPPMSAEQPTRHALILLVEDETAVRHAIARSLRRLGYTVHEAGDGEEGIALGRLHRNRIELLLSDVVMPGADGFVVAATLSTELPGLRVLMMSGYSTDARAQFAGEAPAHRMLEKPFSMSALAAAVAEVLDAPIAGEVDRR